MPKALTGPKSPGLPLEQSTKGKGVIRRWTSWYDPKLVTRSGEDLLSRIDDDAIKVLRRHMLIWSSWTFFKPHFDDIGPFAPGWGLRRVKLGKDATLLHKFALSIIWRMAASTLPDTAEVTLPADLQENIRLLLVENKAPTPAFVPTLLIQISTQGTIHNQLPWNDVKVQPAVEDVPQKELKMTRLYLDGLVFHCHWNHHDFDEVGGNNLLLGAAEEIIITGVSYAGSLQYENLLTLAYESFLGPIGSPIKS